MNFLKKIFHSKDQPVRNYTDFWNWFQENEKDFFNVVKSQNAIHEKFFDKLSSKLEVLGPGYFYVTGMYDKNTAELILTADGNTKNIAFVEELVAQAPEIKNWKFTALKPASTIEDVTIDMGGLRFDADNLFFYSNDHPDHPDEIDISVVHSQLTSDNLEQATNGIYIFLDNYLGELNFVNSIDHLQIIPKENALKELVPIAKLKDFLAWRQKEFIEKYEGLRYNTEEDEHTILESEFESGDTLLAVINTSLLDWDCTASHPWIAVMTIPYDGSNSNGMPNASDYQTLNSIEDEIMKELVDKDGYLNVGRQTAKNEREIYFACRDFRKPSKVFYEIQKKYSGLFEIVYDIYKDKYWLSFQRFKQS